VVEYSMHTHLTRGNKEESTSKPGLAGPRQVAHWNFATRIAFRFTFVYFSLVCVNQGIFMALFPNLKIPGIDSLWPVRQMVFWTGAHVFHLSRSVVYSGGSDSTYNWIHTFCLLVISLVAAGIWAVLDRRRENHITLHKWFRLFIRFILASVLFGYGFFKVIPLQMAFPSLVRLVEPFGHFEPRAVLFWSIGAARGYEIFTGLVEVLGGILLLVPRTTTLGALVCLAATIEVFAVNMAYGMFVKLFSFHLVLFSIFLLAPDTKRMLSFFLSSQATGPSTQPPLFQNVRANRIALTLQVLFGLFLIAMNLHTDIHTWFTLGGGRPKPSLYGIWDVEEMSVDYTTSTSFQRMDDTFVGFGSSIDDKEKTLTLTRAGSPSWKTVLVFDRPIPEQLSLDGVMDGHKIHMRLRLFDRNKFPLVSSRFQWITDF
jgi:hypothetical protein